MEITTPVLRGLQTTFSKVFADGYANTKPWWSRYASRVTSNSRSNTYGWAAKRTRVREWVGERVVQNLTNHSYAIANKPWEWTVGVDRDDIEDDNLGVYTLPVQEGGEEFAKHPDDLILQLMQEGESTLCFDGQNFYDTDHPVDMYDSSKGTQSNYEASGYPLTQANLLAVLAKMMGYKGEDGRPLRVNPNVLTVGPANMANAKALLESDLLLQAVRNLAGTENVAAAAASNITKGILELDVIPELVGDGDAWYVSDTRKAIKPWVYQVRRAPVIVARVDLRDDNVFWQKEFIFGGDSRDNAGNALWFLTHKARA